MSTTWRAYKKKGVSKERPVADEEVVRKLIQALEGESIKSGVYYKLHFATGMRRNEACGLRWSDINWKQRSLHIQQNVVKAPHYPIMVKGPKTQASNRIVYLSEGLCNLLKAWQSESEWEKEQLGQGALLTDDHLFRQQDGNSMVPNTSPSGSRKSCGKMAYRRI